MKVLILGVNGFIGSHLVKAILKQTNWEIYGMDLDNNKLNGSLENPRFHFIEGDISIHHEWVEYHIKKCDVVLPLVAIATPMLYVKDPLRVFELDFEENLRIVRLCVKYKKRILFPSTSEVYGMCADAAFDEETSPLVLGPVRKERWIYSCSKQLLDRVIWAYGSRDTLQFTLFRPFNWIGPKLDDLNAAKEGSSRVVTQFIADLVNQRPIKLVDGGAQRRCFTYIDDGIACLMKIIENKNNVCQGKIFNIGNPRNDCSIKDLALQLKNIYERLTGKKTLGSSIIHVDHNQHYGHNYQDIYTRTPRIANAKKMLHWEPIVELEDALEKTVSAFLEELTVPTPKLKRTEMVHASS